MMILVDLLAQWTSLAVLVLLAVALPACWSVVRSRHSGRYLLVLAAVHAAAAVLGMSAALGFLLSGELGLTVTFCAIFLAASLSSWGCVSAARWRP